VTLEHLTEARTRTLAGSVTDARVLVTTGAGGVGKTTTAAALGLAAARAGRDVLVMTIDPARRLAQAMGLEELTDEPQRVALDAGSGQLHAMMLDMQSTFDSLIDRHAASPQRAADIKRNRIYRTLSSSLAGTQEYMAMEKLHELHDRGDHELLVIDTPPTRSALDFLDAPQRMSSFLEGRLLRALLRPAVSTGRGIGRVVNAGATAFMRVAGRVTGMELLEDLSDFFGNFEGMYEGFKERADEVLALLRQPESRFVIVASPEPPPLREARFFLDRLQQEGLHAAGVVVNRVHVAPTDDDPIELRALADRVEHDSPAGHALALLADVAAIEARERRDVDAALFGTAPRALVEVPLLRGDVHDLRGLATIATHLTGGDGPATTGEATGDTTTGEATDDTTTDDA
jgi:anion-transporting  ArsA/GET3 family ATPase